MSEAAEHCILGFEGGWRESHPVTWGSAALWDGERVVNMGSGFGRRGREEWDELVKDGAVTAFSRPIPVKPGALSQGARVLAMRLRPDGAGFVGPGLDGFASENSLGAWAQNGYVAVLYRDDEAFDADVQSYVTGLCRRFDGLLSTALVLNCHSLELNALRTTLRFLRGAQDSDAMTKALGRAILRGDSDLAAFDRIFGQPVR